MDIHSPFVLVFVSLIILSAVIYFKKHTSAANNLPPGPWKLPLIGNMHNILGSVPHRSLHQLALKHGQLMQLQLGELSAVVVSSADAAKKVFKFNDVNFATRPVVIAADIIGYGGTGITFAPYGDYWRLLRKICTLELLSVRRVQSFRALRHQVYLDLARWIASMEGTPLNLTSRLYSSTYAFTTTATLGKLTKERETLLPYLRQVIALSAGFDIADVFPSVKLLRKMSRMIGKLTRIHEYLDVMLDQIVREHKAAYAAGQEKHEDLLDVLLKFQEEETELPLTIDNIKSVVVDMLGAGSETSATTMDWAMAEMLNSPRVLAKVQEEVRQVFDDKGYVEESRIHELKYFKAVVKETLRLHPSLPLLLPRKCSQTCEIDGYAIPAETKIIVNAWAINRDPQYWENPDCFVPERFLDSSVDFRGNHYEYIPFGAGKRICPGMMFGLANVELPLAMFLYHFDWKLGDGKLDMSEGIGATAGRKKDLCVIPIVNRQVPSLV